MKFNYPKDMREKAKEENKQLIAIDTGIGFSTYGPSEMGISKVLLWVGVFAGVRNQESLQKLKDAVSKLKLSQKRKAGKA